MHTLTSLHVDVRPCARPQPIYKYRLGSSGRVGGGRPEVDASTGMGENLGNIVIHS